MKKITLFIVISLLVCGCSNNSSKEKDTNHSIGKYVYVDSRDVLHSKKCYVGTKVTNEYGQSITLPIQFIDTTSISSQHLKNLCPICVTDEQFDILQRIANRNEEIIDF